MDLPDQRQAFEEIHRVLRPGGFLQFSITHPCFFPPYRRQVRTPESKPFAVELGQYFERVDGKIDRWLFSAAPQEVKADLKPFEIPVFHRPLSEWLEYRDSGGIRVGATGRAEGGRRDGAARA